MKEHPKLYGPSINLCQAIGSGRNRRWIASEYKLPKDVRLVLVDKDDGVGILDCCRLHLVSPEEELHLRPVTGHQQKTKLSRISHT